MGSTRRILIVEDEPNVRTVFRTALTSDEYMLSIAEDGEAALRYLARNRFDLVLLDLQMPRVGGMEMLRRLRGSGNDTPVVIVSAHDGVPNVVQAMRLGAIDFLPKPTTPGTLRKVVADVLARHVLEPGPAPPKPAPVDPAEDALAAAKRALNRRDFDEADTLLDKAIKLRPRFAEVQYLRGVLHELREEPHAAYGCYRAALVADPRFEPARLHLMKYFSDKVM